jgi:hypothetical protein
VRRALALAALLALAAPAGAVEVPKRCDAGRTLFVSGRLRVFAVSYRDPAYWGTDQYACLGHRGPPLRVGGTYDDYGVGTNATPAYVFAGGRYLASLDTGDSEGGPSAYYWVYDLRRGRHVAFENVPYSQRLPTFRVAGGGRLVHRRQVAVRGHTVYWLTGAGEPRSERLAGPPAPANMPLSPVRAQRRPDACARARGRTVAASPSVRVLARDGRRFACRHGDPRLRPVRRRARLRIAHDRWLLVARGSAVVRDTRTGRSLRASRALRPQVLQDGTLVWSTASGALRAHRFGAAATTLASAAAGVAVSGRTVYWRAGGTVHAWRS